MALSLSDKKLVNDDLLAAIAQKIESLETVDLDSSTMIGEIIKNQFIGMKPDAITLSILLFLKNFLERENSVIAYKEKQGQGG